MNTPNTPAKSVNAWIYLDEDEPTGTGYTSSNSSYQSMVRNNGYAWTDMLFICFFDVVSDGNGYYTIQVGNIDQIHPDNSTTEQYLQYTIRDARAQNPGIQLLATLNYNTDTLSQIFSTDSSQWPTEAQYFAANVLQYLSANGLNGLDVDWEGGFSTAIKPEQFAILFQAIRSAFDGAGSYMYLTLSPASVGHLDVNTMNTCFDLVNLQLYSGFTSVDEFTRIGINPSLMAYGAKFESNQQTADAAYAQAQEGFDYNGEQYQYNNITQWRLNSTNYVYEQSQQSILYMLAYGVPSASFDDGALVEQAGSSTITSLSINSGDVLDAIQTTNTGSFGDSSSQLGLLQHGGNGGNSSPVTIDAQDPIITISGYAGNWYGWDVVAQLSLITQSGKILGPYGNMGGVSNQVEFTYSAPAGQSIVAFNGTVIQVPTASGAPTLVISVLEPSFA